MLVVGREVAVLVDCSERRHRVDGQRYRRDDDEEHRYDRQHLTQTRKELHKRKDVKKKHQM